MFRSKLSRLLECACLGVGIIVYHRILSIGLTCTNDAGEHGGSEESGEEPGSATRREPLDALCGPAWRRPGLARPGRELKGHLRNAPRGVSFCLGAYRQRLKHKTHTHTAATCK